MLLGVNGVCVIAHGSSEARTITNAIRNAMSYVNRHVNDGIVEALATLGREDVGVIYDVANAPFAGEGLTKVTNRRRSSGASASSQSIGDSMPTLRSPIVFS